MSFSGCSRSSPEATPGATCCGRSSFSPWCGARRAARRNVVAKDYCRKGSGRGTFFQTVSSKVYDTNIKEDAKVEVSGRDSRCPHVFPGGSSQSRGEITCTLLSVARLARTWLQRPGPYACRHRGWCQAVAKGEHEEHRKDPVL